MSLPAWRRNQYVMATTVFVVFTGFAFVLPFLTLYVRELGVADEESAASWAGLLIGIAPLLAGLLAPLWGRWADRNGQKRLALVALAWNTLLLALSAAVTNVGQLLALRIGVGLFGGIGPLGLAMATAGVPREETGKAVGMVQAAQILAAAVGPFAGGYLADTAGIRVAFLATAGLCALAFVLVVLGFEEPPRASAARSQAPRSSFGAVLRKAGVPSLLVVLFLVNFVGRSFTPILPLHLQQLGVARDRLAFSTGVLISAYSVAAAASASLLGHATRTRSPLRLLAASLVAGALTVLPMALVRSFDAVVLLAVLVGLASGGCLTLCYTIGGLRVPEAERTTAFGFFSSAALFGGAVSPSVAGLLVHWQLRGIYYVDAAIFVALTAAVVLTPSPAGHSPEDRALG